MQHYNVLAPGPVNLHPEVQKILGLPMIHHRTPEFDKILASALSNLKKIFQTEQPCFVLTSTGSGGMESLLVNTIHPGDKVIAIDSGKFGERWAEMAQVFGAKVIPMKIKWGEAVSVPELAALLNQHPDTKHVLCQACETSTGVLHPIQEIAALLKTKPDILFLVDAITALGAFSIPMDEWGIDGLVGGSQKAFMLPTGLSFVSFSKKAWTRIEQNPTPRYYFDVRRELKANQKGETFFSSNVTLIRALDFVLKMILDEGLDKHFARIKTRSDFTLRFAKNLGLCSYSLSPSPSLTALAVPKNIDSQQLRGKLEKDHAITIMGGQDQLKGKIIRIGHMGQITKDQMSELMLKIGATIKQMDPAHNFDSARLESEMKHFWRDHA